MKSVPTEYIKVLPAETLRKKTMQGYGAEVVVVGDNWNQANEQAKQALSEVSSSTNHSKQEAASYHYHFSLEIQ